MLAVTPVWNMHSQIHIPCLTGPYFFILGFLLFTHLFHSGASDVYIPILGSCRTILSSFGFLTSCRLHLVLWKTHFFSLRWYFPLIYFWHLNLPDNIPFVRKSFNFITSAFTNICIHVGTMPFPPSCTFPQVTNNCRMFKCLMDYEIV